MASLVMGLVIDSKSTVMVNVIVKRMNIEYVSSEHMDCGLQQLCQLEADYDPLDGHDRDTVAEQLRKVRRTIVDNECTPGNVTPI